MSDFYKNNDNKLRDKLTQHEFSQVPGSWESMSKLLDQKLINTKTNSLFWWSVPFLALVTIASIIAIRNYTEVSKQQPLEIHLTHQTTRTSVNLEKNIVEGANSSTSANTISNDNSEHNSMLRNDIKVKTITPKMPSSATAEINKSNGIKSNDKFHSNSVEKTLAKRNENKKDPQIQTRSSSTNNTNNVTQNISGTQNNNPINTFLNNNELSKTNTFLDKTKTKQTKTTRTITRYQYSSTPLKTLKNKNKAIQKKHTEPINFGIGDDFLLNKKSPIKFSIYGGASTRIYDAQRISFMPFGGLSFSHKLASRHELEMGIQYKSIGNLAKDNDSENNNKNYNCMNQTSKSYTTTRIDMLELPLVYKLHLHPKLNINAGVKGAWLFNTQTSNPEINKKSNKELGIATFDLGILLGIDLNLTKNWSLGIQYNLGLIDLTQEANRKHNQSLNNDNNAGINTQAKLDVLSSPGELLVPVINSPNHQELLRLPKRLKNNDFEILLRYTF